MQRKRESIPSAGRAGIEGSAGWFGTRAIQAAGLVWASPVTLVGLVLGLPAALSRSGRIARLRGKTPALLVTGPLADRMLALHPLGNIIGVSIGHVVIVRESCLTERLLEHELAHVRQAARWGPLFPFAYLASSLHQYCCGKRAYYDNVFEIEARAAEACVAARYAANRSGEETSREISGT